MDLSALRREILLSNKSATEKTEIFLLKSKVNDMSKDEWRKFITGIPEDVEKGIGALMSADAATPAGDAAIDIASSAQAYLQTRFWWAVAVEMVEVETDDLPVKRFVVPRNQYGQLCVDSNEKFLAGSGQILVSIGNGYPACKDGWTLNSYSAIPIQLHVAPKPGARLQQALAYPTQQSFFRTIWSKLVA
ncbi:MAG: hypothetical protein FRX49_06032 [Trebouxia sp. A1-2]|nr:MAG: hypothetical protein FRX49_06032 [Trebouxia sp. A1-2]